MYASTGVMNWLRYLYADMSDEKSLKQVFMNENITFAATASNGLPGIYSEGHFDCSSGTSKLFLHIHTYIHSFMHSLIHSLTHTFT